MHRAVYVQSDNIISPLGFTSGANFMQLKNGVSAVKLQQQPAIGPVPTHAAMLDDAELSDEFEDLQTKKIYSKFEKLVILSVDRALKAAPHIDPRDPRTIFILSTTKGNIALLDDASDFDKNRLRLSVTASMIAEHFGFVTTPVVISNACVSGVLAVIYAKRMISAGFYDQAVVAGADLLSHFVISGFHSFKAVSDEVAKPYDAARNGISLGEGCATMVLSATPSSMEVTGGASSNDANHISGPSRTGDGLLLAIRNTLNEAKLHASDIGFISGHGTATLFNDEMEALAINDAGLSAVPMNSLKSYFGHTLGAAGLIESIIGIHSIRESTLIGTYNYSAPGTSKPLNILKATTEKSISNCLKTAAGFGGCNAAVIFEKR